MMLGLRSFRGWGILWLMAVAKARESFCEFCFENFGSSGKFAGAWVYRRPEKNRPGPQFFL